MGVQEPEKKVHKHPHKNHKPISDSKKGIFQNQKLLNAFGANKGKFNMDLLKKVQGAAHVALLLNRL